MWEVILSLYGFRANRHHVLVFASDEVKAWEMLRVNAFGFSESEPMPIEMAKKEYKLLLTHDTSVEGVVAKWFASDLRTAF